MERIAELIAASPLQHGDETGIRIYGMLHWLHVNSTRLSDPPGLACVARARGHGRDRHLAALLGTGHA